MLAYASSTIDGAAQGSVAQAQRRWQSSPHGPMLARILPPRKTPAAVPEPNAPGAQLTVRYCVQCHHLPNPAMHSADKWPAIVNRMVWRMRGNGNMGDLMREMMAGIAAPTAAEHGVLTAYLRKHGQRPLVRTEYPDLATRGAVFRDACSQCHALPDPKAHRRSEWPPIVERMEGNMSWMNRVVGSKPDAREPQWRTDDIISYLQRHARQD